MIHSTRDQLPPFCSSTCSTGVLLLLCNAIYVLMPYRYNKRYTWTPGVRVYDYFYVCMSSVTHGPGVHVYHCCFLSNHHGDFELHCSILAFPIHLRPEARVWIDCYKPRTVLWAFVAHRLVVPAPRFDPCRSSFFAWWTGWCSLI